MNIDAYLNSGLLFAEAVDPFFHCGLFCIYNVTNDSHKRCDVICVFFWLSLEYLQQSQQKMKF